MHYGCLPPWLKTTENLTCETDIQETLDNAYKKWNHTKQMINDMPMKQLIVPNKKLRHTIQITNDRSVYILIGQW